METKVLFSILLFSFITLDAQIDYQTQVQTVFSSQCTACHGTTSGVSLGTYEKTMGSTGVRYGTKIVSPGSRDTSPLFDKINPSPAIGSRMPFNRTPLDMETINTIGQWIDEGALEVVTGIKAVSAPESFVTAACYPNPFNPVTTLRFELPFNASVIITVVNLEGQIVFRAASLYAQGTHEIRIGLQEHPSGIYFAQLTALTDQGIRASQSVKLTLLK